MKISQSVKCTTAMFYCASLIVALLATACGEQQATEADSAYRFWTTSDNRRSSTRLKLVEKTDAAVKLQREDNGTVLQFRIDRLSRADQDYVREIAKRSPEAVGSVSSSNWSQFRGPNRSGTSDDTSLPREWSGTKNIVWRSPLPGPGASSPIVFGDHVYVTCYSGYGLNPEQPGVVNALKRHLVCANRKDGTILWQADVKYDRDNPVFEFTGFNALHGFATSTPVADESGVFVYFGTSGAFAYSHDGKPLWNSRLGSDINGWGTASSPILFGDLLIVHADIEAHAMVALNKTNGQEAWRAPTGGADSWSTPLIVDTNGRQELIFHHSQGNPDATMAALNPRDGRELWRCNVLCNYLCPSPIANDGIVYAIAYQRGAAIRAGDVADDSRILWQNRRGSEICTPVYHDGHLYFSHQEEGFAFCIDARSGETVYQERLTPSSRQIYASAVLADGRIYYVSREKGTYVVAAKPQFEQLAHNVIENDESIFNATPAIGRGQLFLRSNTHLYCIGSDAK